MEGCDIISFPVSAGFLCLWGTCSVSDTLQHNAEHKTHCSYVSACQADVRGRETVWKQARREQHTCTAGAHCTSATAEWIEWVVLLICIALEETDILGLAPVLIGELPAKNWERQKERHEAGWTVAIPVVDYKNETISQQAWFHHSQAAPFPSREGEITFWGMQCSHTGCYQVILARELGCCD